MYTRNRRAALMSGRGDSEGFFFSIFDQNSEFPSLARWIYLVLTTRRTKIDTMAGVGALGLGAAR